MTALALVNSLELLVLGYLGVGCAFSIHFFARRIKNLDSASQTGSLGFRLSILPGVIALWPHFLFQKSANETTADRSLDRSRQQQAWLFVFFALAASIALAAAVASRTPRVDPEPPSALRGK